MTLENLQHTAAASGGIIYIMAILLLIALTLIIERSIYLYRALGAGRMLMVALDEHSIPTLSLPKLKELAMQHHGMPHERLLKTAISLRQEPDPEHQGSRMEEAIMREVPHIDRHLWILDTIVTLAPLLGLLGTIIGMFHAFSVLSDANNAPTQVTGGVAQALIATAGGLFIAILGLVAFNGLNNRIRVILHHLETIKIMLLNRVKTKNTAKSSTEPLRTEVA